MNPAVLAATSTYSFNPLGPLKSPSIPQTRIITPPKNIISIIDTPRIKTLKMCDNSPPLLRDRILPPSAHIRVSSPIIAEDFGEENAAVETCSEVRRCAIGREDGMLFEMEGNELLRNY